MSRIDFTPLFRSTVGFDRMTDLLESALNREDAGGYPPYNIEKLGKDDYRITLAVAGFSPEDVEIEVRDGVLTITGKGSDDKPDVTYLHRGIAERNFRRTFRLAEHVKVIDATMENGLLHINLTHELPEAMKPRRIKITSARTGSDKLVEAGNA